MSRTARRVALPLVVAGLLLTGCQQTDPGGPTPGQGTTDEGATTMDDRADERAAEEQAPRTREILRSLWEQFDLEDKPPLEEEAGERGQLRMCSLGVDDHLSSWSDRAGLRVAQQEDPDLEAAQAELVRTWMDDNGFERIDNPAPEDSPLTYHRSEDGFFVTVAPQGDARVFLDVESPCFDDQGQRVVGTTSRTDG